MNKKKIIIIALCTVLLFSAAVFGYNYLSENYQPKSEDLSGTVSEPEQPEENEPETPAEDIIMAPDFTVYDAEGNAVKLSDFSGKPVVINFWATWCGYCVREMPAFEKIAAEYSDEVVFMMINVTDGQKETKEEALAFIEEKGYTFPVYYDTSGNAVDTFGIRGIPLSLFIDADGNLVTYANASLSAEMLEKAIGYIYEGE